MVNPLDIMQKPLAAKDIVVFCRAGSSKRMTVGTITRILPKTVEVSFSLDGGRVNDSVFRAPEDVVRV
jgi:hypothetical protein